MPPQPSPAALFDKVELRGQDDLRRVESLLDEAVDRYMQVKYARCSGATPALEGLPAAALPVGPSTAVANLPQAKGEAVPQGLRDALRSISVSRTCESIFTASCRAPPPLTPFPRLAPPCRPTS
jgi:hypothetical protein